MEVKKMDKNLEYVNEIVKTMEKYASGDYFIWNGDLFPTDERDFANVPGCTIQKKMFWVRFICFT